MKKILFILIVTILYTSSGFAQPHDKHERIKALKIAYITDKLALTSEQSAAFWPIYNEYEKERWALRTDFFEAYKDKNPSADPKTAHQYINDDLEYQQEELDLKKKYKEKLLKVISAQQLAELYRSEHGFKKMLIEELRERRGPR